MNEFGVGLSDNLDSFAAATEAVHSAKALLGDTAANTVIILTKPDLKPEEIIEGVARSSGTNNIIGNTSDTLLNSINQADANILTLLLNDNLAKSESTSVEINNETPRILGEKIGNSLNKIRFNKQFLLIFFPNIYKNTLEIIKGIQSVLGKSFPIFGIASSTQSNPNYLFAERKAKTNLISATLLGGEMQFGFGLAHGWKPLGKPHKITRQENNVIYEIDNKQALSIYRQYLGEQILDWNKSYFRQITYYYPLGFSLGKNKEYILRSGLTIGEKGSLICEGEIPQDAEVHLMITNRNSVIESTKNAIGQTLLSFRNKPLKFMLLFSSIARYNLLGKNRFAEIIDIKQCLNEETPIIGCTTQMEIAPLTKTSGFPGESFIYNNCILTIGIG